MVVLSDYDPASATLAVPAGSDRRTLEQNPVAVHAVISSNF
jgi:hypothetical protein